MTPAERERGAAVVELVVLTPLLLLLLIFVVAAGRLTETRLRVDDAAHQAARAASLARDPVTAQRAAQASVIASLAGGDAACAQPRVAVDVGRFQPGSMVTVSVSCTVDLRDLSPLPVPGARTLSARFASPLDTYRGAALGLTSAGSAGRRSSDPPEA